MSFQDKVVFITGSNGGIGRALVQSFAQQGSIVYAHARKPSEEFVHFLTHTEEKYGTRVHPVYFDLEDTVHIKAQISALIKQKVRFDILVNCAGKAHGALFQMTKIEDIRTVFEVNFFSQLEVTQLILRTMIRQRNGCIINIASIAGIDLHSGNSAYGVSKAALIAWTQTLAAEVAASGVRVNAIAPGLVDTNMATLMDPKAAKTMIDSSAMKRLIQPQEIVNCVLFLASEASSFVNGQTLRIDGGHI